MHHRVYSRCYYTEYCKWVGIAVTVQGVSSYGMVIQMDRLGIAPSLSICISCMYTQYLHLLVNTM